MIPENLKEIKKTHEIFAQFCIHFSTLQQFKLQVEKRQNGEEYRPYEVMSEERIVALTQLEKLRFLIEDLYEYDGRKPSNEVEPLPALGAMFQSTNRLNQTFWALLQRLQQDLWERLT